MKGYANMSVYKDKKRGTYYYEGSYIDLFGNQKRYKKRGFTTYNKAKENERLFLINCKETPTQRYTYNELFHIFIEYKQKRVKERTIYDYKATAKKHILPYFGDMYVDKITIPIIEHWQNNLLKLNIKNSYIDSIQTLMSSIMKFGVRKMIIKENPFNYLEFVKHTNQSTSVMKFWTLEQYKKFRSVITVFEDILLFDTLYWTGMRISELQARTWEDFNEFDGTLTIHSNYNNKNRTITKSTKTGENRIIYLNKSLLNELKTWKKECFKIDGFSEKFYIHGFYKPIPHKTVENKKNKYISLYNSQNEDDQIPVIRIHDFRHSHVSLLINNNVDSFTIAERLGHSKEMVERRYGHMFPEKKKKILNVLDSF